MINVLIACEESQAECMAFRSLGFNAYSCDIQPCRPAGRKDWHIMADVTPYLHGCTQFTTMDGVQHIIDHWHLIIAHPPCTYLCRVSSVHLIKDGVLDEERFAQMKRGAEFFRECLSAEADYVAVENPIPMKRAGLPPCSCYTQPFWFGVKYSKKTLWWLRGLPPIVPSIIYPNPREFVRASRGKYRSRTFPQVAQAIAEQWGAYILDKM